MLLGTGALKEKLESEGLHWQLALVGWRGRSTRPGWDRFSRSEELAWSWRRGPWMTERSLHLPGPGERIRGLEQGWSSHLSWDESLEINYSPARGQSPVGSSLGDRILGPMPLATSFLRAFAPGRLHPPVLPIGCDELRGALQRADLQEGGGERGSALEFSLYLLDRPASGLRPRRASEGGRVRVWSWVTGRLMPLSCRAGDPAVCFSVYSRHMLLSVGEKWEPGVKLSYLAPAASQARGSGQG